MPNILSVMDGVIWVGFLIGLKMGLNIQNREVEGTNVVQRPLRIGSIPPSKRIFCDLKTPKLVNILIDGIFIDHRQIGNDPQKLIGHCHPNEDIVPKQF